jgi:hypothetical protein
MQIDAPSARRLASMKSPRMPDSTSKRERSGCECELPRHVAALDSSPRSSREATAITIKIETTPRTSRF